MAPGITSLQPMHYDPEHFLNRDAAGSRLLAHARLLLKLERRFAAIVPAGFRHSARVANFKAGKIVIHTDNGAVAAKIRQMSQRLCTELSKGDIVCEELEVKVQPRQPEQPTHTSTQKPISAKSVGMLRSTSENLPKGPLREALENLLARAAKAE